MIVEVYRNLHKQLWSVRDPKTGRVISHSDRVVLVNAKLVVRPGGRAKALLEKRRNVHAFVRGELQEWSRRSTKAVPITYNPFLMANFQTLEGVAVKSSSMVWLDSTMKAYAKLEE